MSQNVLLVFAVATSVSLNLFAGFQLLKSKKTRNSLFAAEPSPLPTRDEPLHIPEGAAVTVNEVLCPLIEAEVFFAYGRRHDAEAVLASALRKGQIGPDDVRSLRDKLNTQRHIELSAAV